MCRQLSEQQPGIGLANILAEISTGVPTALILSDDERFYEVEACFLARTVNNLGGCLVVIPQRDLVLKEDGIVDSANLSLGTIRHIIAPPVFSGSKVQRKELQERLETLIQGGTVTSFSDRSPVLSNKVLMALISNSLHDEDLERLLQSCFEPSILERLRRFLPATAVPLNKADTVRIEESIKGGKSLFVKALTASGARGVAGPGELAKQLELLKPTKSIAQEAIPALLTRFDFCDLQTAEVGSNDFAIRLGLFVVTSKIADISITASPRIVAHGSRDSIQTGIKIIEQPK